MRSYISILISVRLAPVYAVELEHDLKVAGATLLHTVGLSWCGKAWISHRRLATRLELVIVNSWWAVVQLSSSHNR